MGTLYFGDNLHVLREKEKMSHVSPELDLEKGRNREFLQIHCP